MSLNENNEEYIGCHRVGEGKEEMELYYKLKNKINNN